MSLRGALSRRFLRRGARPGILAFGIAALAGSAGLWAEDLVAVPGGPASYRRLFGLDPGRPDSAFFVDLHEVLLFGAPESAEWSKIESRRKAMDFGEDLAEWRRLFGNPARFSSAPGEDGARSRRALEWLGFQVERDGASFSTRRLGDERSARRQTFLDVLGASTSGFLGQLRAGETATISSDDASAPLPFGLDAWRETLSEKSLGAENAFVFFLQHPRASRMLVALHALDRETREELRHLARGAGGTADGWKILYEKALDAFFRYPEAAELRGGRFVLPGGPDADSVWTEVLGASPSEPAAFLDALYEKDEGKGAYVVDSLRHVPESAARALLLPAEAPAENASRRFRRIYASIDRGGDNYRRTRRDPYDFAQLAPFLTAASKAAFQIGDPRETRFPRNERELAALVAESSAAESSEDIFFRRLFDREASRAIEGPFPAQRRFLFLSSLLAQHPALADPGLVLLLERGFDRFGPAYSVFDDIPTLSPAHARRYLFTLDRLERRGSSRSAELAAGLFQGSIGLLALVSRAKGLDPPAVAAAFESLVALPLFADEDVTPASGEAALYVWLAGTLLPAIEVRQRGAPTPSAAPARGPGESAAASDRRDSDELVFRATTGSPATAAIEWRGARFRFDPTEDEISRRRAFRERQRLTWIEDLEALHRTRDAAFEAFATGDLEEARARTAELTEDLGIAGGNGGAPDGEDERIRKEEARARDLAEEIAALKPDADLSAFVERFATFDAVLAERHLEALLGHAYAAAARDPEDLYYQDPTFVRKHSFRFDEKGGEIVRTPFSPPVLVREGGGGGSRIAGSIFGLTEILGLLHADQLAYGSGGRIANEEIRAGLVASIWEMSASRLSDDSLEIVAASCRAAQELARDLAGRPFAERLRIWEAVARDLVPRSRLAVLASHEEPDDPAISESLSPTDLYRIGRRLLARERPAGLSDLALREVGRGREALARLEAGLGELGSRELLSEFGPLPAAYAGHFRLLDLDMPAYERLAAYRRPEMFSERLYDLKIAVACRIAEERLPAAVLPIVLPPALDNLLVRVRMAYPYDWEATARAAVAFSRGDLERLLDDAVGAGRLVREENTASDTGGAR
jgi:hypothetical protein